MILAGYVFDTSTCLWRAVTGVPCPGCGMIHALLAMTRGDFHAAWAFNRGSFAAVPILAWTAIRKIEEIAA